MRSLVARWLMLTSAKVAVAERSIGDQLSLWFHELVADLDLTPGQTSELEAGFTNTMTAGAATMVILVEELALRSVPYDTNIVLTGLAEKYGFDVRPDVN